MHHSTAASPRQRQTFRNILTKVVFQLSIATMFLFIIYFLLNLGPTALAQEPGVAGRDTVIKGDYSGALRPQIHFSPPQNFMNDPNGCFRDANGTWHLYYQYNPTASVAGNQHWGHATSKDLYHWENQPIAIYVTDPEHYIFSGSAVVDVNNTSGFFPNQTDGVVAIYTVATKTNQNQDISYSTDGGYTFTPYPKNPVIDLHDANFRDPKVIWHSKSQKWVMVVAHSQDLRLSFYTSSDLKSWKLVSTLGGIGWISGNYVQYECPNMVEVQSDDGGSTWVLIISINPGGPQGGSFTEFFPGDFNGTHFVPDGPATGQIDWGKDNYAGQFFYDAQEPETQKPVLISWMNNWDYCNVVPTGDRENWRSIMGLPREASLKKTDFGWGFSSPPVDLSPMLGKTILSKTISGNGTQSASMCGTSGAVYFQANFTSASMGKANITFTNRNERLVVGISFSGNFSQVYINRAGLKGFNYDLFTNVVSTQDYITNQEYSIYGVFDRSVIEVFLYGTDESGSMVFYPEKPLTDIGISTSGMAKGTKVSFKATELKSAWQEGSVDVCKASLGGGAFNNGTGPAGTSATGESEASDTQTGTPLPSATGQTSAGGQISMLAVSNAIVFISLALYFLRF